MHQGADLVRTLDVHIGRRRMLQLLAIGQNALAGQFGRHRKRFSVCKNAPMSLMA
jgi:hypothetical protein